MKKNIYFTNRKEYYRRQRISESLKIYYAERKLTEKISLKFKKEYKKAKPTKIKIPIFKKRIRKQICYNCEYSLSIRAIQINGKAILEELEHSLNIFLEQNELLINIRWDTQGLEVEEISDDEDAGLKENLIYIEFNNRGHQNLITF